MMKLFKTSSQRAPSEMFKKVLNTPLQSCTTPTHWVHSLETTFPTFWKKKNHEIALHLIASLQFFTLYNWMTLTICVLIMSYLRESLLYSLSLPFYSCSLSVCVCVCARACDELFLWHGWPTKGIEPHFQPGPLSEILTVANFRHAASRVWTFAEPEFRLSWMKLCRNYNLHYNTAS